MPDFDEHTLERLKAVELDLLLELQRVCGLLGTGFFLDSGTLLGAARHGGFIPWDDDIDIGMLRDDYERFLAEAPALLGEEYFLQSRGSDPGTHISFAKLRRNGTVMLERAGAASDAHRGIWIDIFPFDWTSSNPSDLQGAERDWRFWHRLLTLRMVGVASKESSPIKRAVRHIVRIPTLVRSCDYYCRKIDSLARNWEGQEDPALTCFHYMSVFVRMPKSDALPLATLDFEGHPMPVFRNWELYLRQVYGDWRTPPPECRREPHHDVLRIDFGDCETERLLREASL